MPENTIDPAAGLNIALNAIDAMLQCAVISVGDNDPPSEPTEGDRYIVGVSPSGEWDADAGRLAVYIDAGWDFYDAHYVLNQADGAIWALRGSNWVPVTAGRVVDVSGTSYELTPQDNQAIIRFSDGSPCTLTIPSAVAVAGFACTVEQAGAGEVGFAGTATVVNYAGHTTTAGQYAKLQLTCSVAGTINFSGDSAA